MQLFGAVESKLYFFFSWILPVVIVWLTTHCLFFATTLWHDTLLIIGLVAQHFFFSL